ncbi:MAG: hypothetical protein H6Q69_1283 [Firmicutes bacterium]|nr:hypothetical protein [Bacillota bacterium]
MRLTRHLLCLSLFISLISGFCFSEGVHHDNNSASSVNVFPSDQQMSSAQANSNDSKVKSGIGFSSYMYYSDKHSKGSLQSSSNGYNTKTSSSTISILPLSKGIK